MVLLSFQLDHWTLLLVSLRRLTYNRRIWVDRSSTNWRSFIFCLFAQLLLVLFFLVTFPFVYLVLYFFEFLSHEPLTQSQICFIWVYTFRRQFYFFLDWRRTFFSLFTKKIGWAHIMDLFC